MNHTVKVYLSFNLSITAVWYVLFFLVFPPNPKLMMISMISGQIVFVSQSFNAFWVFYIAQVVMIPYLLINCFWSLLTNPFWRLNRGKVKRSVSV